MSMKISMKNSCNTDQLYPTVRQVSTQPQEANNDATYDLQFERLPLQLYSTNLEVHANGTQITICE